MKLQSVSLARSIWLFPVLALNPAGLSLRSLLEAIINKYRFLVYPTAPEQWTSKEVKFENGIFLNSDDVEVAVSLFLYKDGLIADTCSSTDDADAFLRNYLEWLHYEYSLVHYNDLAAPPIKRYASTVHVTYDYPIDKAIPGLQEVAKLVSKSASWHRGSGVMQPTGFSIGQDPAEAKGDIWEFKFERVVDAPFSANTFYSLALCETQTHLQLLRQFELLFPQSPPAVKLPG